MTNNNFDLISEAFNFSINQFKKHWQFLVLLYLAIGILDLFLSKIGNIVGTFETISLSIIIIIVTILLQIGGVTVILKILDKKPYSKKDILRNSNLVIPVILAGILYALIIVGGLILLIIPGIIFMIMFSLYMYILIDQKKGVIDSLKESKRITHGYKWMLFIFIIIMILISIAGSLIPIFGVAVTMPITILAHAYIYRKLAGKGVVKSPSKTPAKKATVKKTSAKRTAKPTKKTTTKRKKK